MASRIINNVSRPEQIRLQVNGESISAYAGETVASVLLMHGISAFYQTPTGRPRAPYCNMGTCFECRVKLANRPGEPWVRACMTTVEEGMKIITGSSIPDLGGNTDAD